MNSAACKSCQAGRCCGSCWCCYDKGRLAELRAQQQQIEQAISETPPTFRAGLHYAAGILVTEIRELSAVARPA